MKKKMSAEEFDQMVDAGEDVSELLVPAGTKAVNLDLPVWMIEALDSAAGLRNIPRKALINTWIFEMLKTEQLMQKNADRRRSAG